MSWGCNINNVYLPRIHKDGVADKLERLREYIKATEQEMVALAVASPVEVDDRPWHEYAPMRMQELIDELTEASWQATLCAIAVDNPEDVEED